MSAEVLPGAVRIPVKPKRNEGEFRVLAMRRSGHHGFIRWLLGHFSGEVVFQNDVSVLRAENTSTFCPSANGTRQAFVFNVENPDIPNVMSQISSDCWRTNKGPSDKTHTLVLLRDPYNWIASRIKAWGAREQYGGTSILSEVALWKQQAREFLGETEYLPKDTLFVSYVEWFRSADYRRGISEKLGLSFTDKNLGINMRLGGSSFDSIDSDPQTLNVLGRWKNFLQHKGYLSLFDRELLDLADRIFGDFSKDIRAKLPRARGVTVWLTGLPGAGKTSIARELETRLGEKNFLEVLDGDQMRRLLCSDLGFSKEDRDENARRIGYAASILTRRGAVAVVSVISPYRQSRREAREMSSDFVEVYVRCSVTECRRRDPKGLYLKSQQGNLKGLTGVDAPYEVPESPEIVVDTEAQSLEACVVQIIKYLRDKALVK